MSDQMVPQDGGEGARQLPVPQAAGALAQARPGSLSLDLLDDRRKEDPDEIDLLAYWRIIVKRKWLVVGVAAAAVALALFQTLATTPIYRATTILQIEKDDQPIMQTAQPVYGGGGWDPEFMETQIQLLRSRSLAERVADELDLGAESAKVAAGRSPLDRFSNLLRRKADKPAASARKPSADPEADLAMGAGIVQGGLSISPIKDSKLVNVNYDSPDPQFAAQVANAVAEGFIESTMERKFGATSYARTYLQEQLTLAKARLEQSERALVAYAQKEGLVTTGENNQSLAAQNLGDLNSALATAQEQRIRAQARLGQASGAAMPPDMLAASNVPALRQQRGALQAQYQEKLRTFKPDYPDMLALKGQIDEIDRQIGAELRAVRASVRAEYNAAAAQESMIKGQLSALRSAALDVDGRSIQYNILKREVDTNRQLYDGLLQRFKEVGVVGEAKSNSFSIIDRAQVPGGPYKPNLNRNLAMGLLAGLLLGVLLAFVLEFLDDTLKTPEDIEQRLRMPVLGIVPRLKKQEPLQALADPRSSFAEAHRSIRGALQFSTDHGVPGVILLTSATPGEGKSTTAIALAHTFVQLGKRVLLIEGDLRNPSLHRTLGQRAEIGLSNVLAGVSPVADAILDTDTERLQVVLAGPLPPNPAELLSGSRLASLLTVAAQQYDQVIIDGPPVIGIADAPLLANIAESTLLVVRSGKSRIAGAQAAVKRLNAARARLLGVVLTAYDAKAAGYHYHYSYDYYSYGNAPQLQKQ